MNQPWPTPAAEDPNAAKKQFLPNGEEDLYHQGDRARIGTDGSTLEQSGGVGEQST